MFHFITFDDRYDDDEDYDDNLSRIQCLRFELAIFRYRYRPPGPRIGCLKGLTFTHMLYTHPHH